MNVKKIECPYCDTIQNSEIVTRRWKYGKANVRRFACKCGKDFNFYDNGSSNWTIPKNPKK